MVIRCRFTRQGLKPISKCNLLFLWDRTIMEYMFASIVSQTGRKKKMFRKLLTLILLTTASLNSYAQFFGSGPELNSLSQFKEGKFKYQSVKSIYWSQIVNEGRRYVDRSEKVWVPAHLFMPANSDKKVSAMVMVLTLYSSTAGMFKLPIVSP